MLALSAAAGAAWAAELPSPAPARVVAGELTHVDLGRRSVAVKPEARDAARTDGADARDVDVAIAPTRAWSRAGGRCASEDLRPDRVVLLVGEEGGGARRAS
jgi:hypothetical protein